MNLAHVSRYFRDPTISTWRKWAGVFALVYVLSPIDAIPDVLPVIGWLDDVGVLGAALAFMKADISRHASMTALRSSSPRARPLNVF